MNQAWITGIQALQLIGLGPCLLLLSFLVLALKEPKRAIAPLLFLLSLSAGFFSVLAPLLDWQHAGWQYNSILLMTEAFPACAFLLLAQFLRGGLPSNIFWLVLLMPVLGSGGLMYLSHVTQGNLCVSTSEGNISCLSDDALHSLYMVIVGGFIMLMMMFEIMQGKNMISAQKQQHRDQYWMIISLVVLTVTILVIELFHLMEQLEAMQGLWGGTLVRLAFVFLMFSSFFRIFGGQYAIAMERVPTAERLLSHHDKAIAEQIEKLLEGEKLYHEMGLSRAQLAERLAIAESRLSNIINRYFGRSFTSLLNDKRVDEAKLRLTAEPKVQITVIAFDVGFNSIATFNRVFKESTGMSPSEWRAKAQ